jgi:pimeloyl-ACP methyl ester carboxylesterase
MMSVVVGVTSSQIFKLSARLCETLNMRTEQLSIHRGTQVMRMQQIMTASAAVSAIIWGVYFWPTSPVLAVLGIFVGLLGFTGVLALEFMTLMRVNRSDPAPQATARELFNAWRAEVITAAVIFCWRQPFRADEVSDRLHGDDLLGQRGVVFIHGLICNRGFWTPWLKRLKTKGSRQHQHAYVAISLEPVFASIDDYVDQIDRAVTDVTTASGLAPILVCHSMGGLAARAWLDHQANASRVHHVVTIGTPHHGTWLARFAHGLSGKQMRQDSEWLQQLNGLTAAISAGKRFTCWYSNCDNIVFPTSTATLRAADNRLVRGAGHLQLAFQPEVIEGTIDLITSRHHLDALQTDV